MKGAVVVGGALARRITYGGHVWALIQWALGLDRLGWSVLFLDRLDPGPGVRSSRRVDRFIETMRFFGLEQSFSLDVGPDEEPIGRARRDVLRFTRDADLLLNIMGYVEDPHVLAAARRRAFLDIDPGFTQMWHALGQCDMLAGHDVFLTVGRNVGRPDCVIPSQGRRWIPVHPPVVTDLWPASTDERGPSFTSVASWRGPYDPVVYEGETYGLRVHEFRKFASLPRDAGLPFEVALDIAREDDADALRLREGGWRLIDPRGVAGGPIHYWKYVRGSGSEFLVAKNMYVRSNSGWMSDRTVCYLASGRPALVQNTGLASELDTGEGLVLFRTPEEAVEGARRIDESWHRHSRAARALAIEHFDARKVLAGVVDAAA